MAGSAKRMISVIIAGDASSLSKTVGEVGNLGNSLKAKLGGNSKEIGRHLTEIGAGATAVGVALIGISKPAEQAHNQLKAAISASGGDFNTYKGKIDQTDARMENFAHTNADTESALTKLTEGLGSPNKALAEMSRVANIAAADHVSLADAASLDVRMHAGATKTFKQFGIQVSLVKNPMKAVEVAQGAMTKAHATYSTALQKLQQLQLIDSTKKKLSVKDYIALKNAQDKVSLAQGAYRLSVQKLADAHTKARAQSHLLDGAFSQLDQKLKGQASAAVEGFGGKWDILRTKVTDFAAKWGEKLGPILVAAGPLLMGLGGIMQSGVIPAMWGMVTAEDSMLAPILLVVGALAALTAGVVYAYTHFQSFRDIVDAVGRWFRDTLWPWLQQVAAGIVNTFDAMKGDFQRIWDGIQQYVQGVVMVIRGIIQTVMALIHGDWGKAWDGIEQTLSGAWQAMLGIVNIGIGWIMAPLHGMAHLAGNLWGWLESGLSGVWSSILSTLGDNVNTAIDVINKLITAADVLPGVNISHLGHVHWGSGTPAAPKQIGHGGSAGGGNTPFGPGLGSNGKPIYGPFRALGGFVPGGFGQAVPIVAHGGEYVNSLDDVRHGVMGVGSRRTTAASAGGDINVAFTLQVAAPPGADARWLRWLADETTKQFRDGGPLGIALRNEIRKAVA